MNTLASDTFAEGAGVSVTCFYRFCWNLRTDAYNFARSQWGTWENQILHWKQTPQNPCVFKPLSALVSTSVLMCEISPCALLSAGLLLILSFYQQFFLSQGSLNSLTRAALHTKARLSKLQERRCDPLGAGFGNSTEHWGGRAGGFCSIPGHFVS